MTRAFRLSLVGSLVLVTLAGCGRGWLQFAEREPWRAEAERTCLKSGTVREGVHITRADSISGPGVCGAEYPLKVAALGENFSSLGFADLRPPGAIPNAGNQPRWPGAQPVPAPNYAAPPQTTYPQPQAYPQSGYRGAPANNPISLTTPGAALSPDLENDADVIEEQAPPQRMPPQLSNSPYRNPQYQPPRQQPLPTLGPSRGAPQTAAIGPVAMKPTATLACPMVSALDRWIADAVQPAATRWFGAQVVEIKQISAYSCRGMNGSSNARISEHAFGNALDIASFTLADGRIITVKGGWRGLPEEQGFLRDVQGAACRQFSTVLAPGSNIYHYDHIHVDLMRRSSGRVICQPEAVSGEMIASRARGGSYAATREPQFTGSLGRSKKSARRAISDDDWIEDESGIR